MNATRSKWNLSLNIHTVFHARQLLQKSESLLQVFTLSSSAAWGWKKFVQSGFHMCPMMTKEPYMFFLPPPIYSIGEMKTVHFLLHFNGWQVMDAFIWHSAATTHSFDTQLQQRIHLTLSCTNAMLNGMPKKLLGRKLYGPLMLLWKSCLLCSSAEMDSCLIIPCQLLQQLIDIMTAHSCRIRWGWLFAVNNQNCVNMVSFCSRTAQHFITIVMCKFWCNIGAGRCWHIHPTF